MYILKSKVIALLILTTAFAAILSLPQSSVIAQAEQPPIVAIDAGHGGSEYGGAHYNKLGKVDLYEKTANLNVALLLAQKLRAAGYLVVLTRNSDSQVNIPRIDRNGNKVIDTDDDLQARVDIANAAHADILVSLHHDSRTYNPAYDNTTVYYCAECAHVSESARLGLSISAAFSQTFALHGWKIPSRGIVPDNTLGKPSGHLYLLGPHNWRIKRPSAMPGVLVEPLFLTNDYAYSLETAPGGYNVMADAYYLGIVNYFRSGSSGR